VSRHLNTGCRRSGAERAQQNSPLDEYVAFSCAASFRSVRDGGICRTVTAELNTMELGQGKAVILLQGIS